MATAVYRFTRTRPVDEAVINDRLPAAIAAYAGTAVGHQVQFEYDDVYETALAEVFADMGYGLLTKNPATLLGIQADQVNYDNALSGLTAVDVQAALDEIAAAAGLTAAAHRALDQLVHGLAETSDTEVVTDAFGRTSRLTVWTDAGRTTRIRETEWAYVLGRVATKTTRQYDGAGAVVETLSETYSYALSGRLSGVTTVLS